MVGEMEQALPGDGLSGGGEEEMERRRVGGGICSLLM